MFFGLFRWVRRKIVLIVFLVAFVIALKQAHPAIGRHIGRWISGTEDNRVTQAFSSFVSSLSDGEGVKDAVEVFRDTLQESS